MPRLPAEPIDLETAQVVWQVFGSCADAAQGHQDLVEAAACVGSQADHEPLCIEIHGLRSSLGSLRLAALLAALGPTGLWVSLDNEFDVVSIARAAPSRAPARAPLHTGTHWTERDPTLVLAFDGDRITGVALVSTARAAHRPA